MWGLLCTAFKPTYFSSLWLLTSVRAHACSHTKHYWWINFEDFQPSCTNSRTVDTANSITNVWRLQMGNFWEATTSRRDCLSLQTYSQCWWHLYVWKESVNVAIYTCGWQTSTLRITSKFPLSSVITDEKRFKCCRSLYRDHLWRGWANCLTHICLSLCTLAGVMCALTICVKQTNGEDWVFLSGWV